MNAPKRPIFFYLFRRGSDIEIVRMTDVEAVGLWDCGKRWIDVPRRTFAEAQEVRKQLLETQLPD